MTMLKATRSGPLDECYARPGAMFPNRDAVSVVSTCSPLKMGGKCRKEICSLSRDTCRRPELSMLWISFLQSNLLMYWTVPQYSTYIVESSLARQVKYYGSSFGS